MNGVLDQMYPVEAKKEDSAKIIIRFLCCPYIFNREVSIYNMGCMKKPMFRPGFIFPGNMFSATFFDDDIPSEEQLNKVLLKSESAFTAIGSLDKGDEDRITMTCFGNKSALHKQSPAFKDRFILAVSGSKLSNRKVGKIIEYLENGEI